MTSDADRMLSRALSRRRLLRAGAIGGAGLAAVAIAGCGSDDDPAPAATTGSSSTSGTTSATGGAASNEPRAGGVVRIGDSREPTIWDPVLSEASPPATYAAPLYPHLFVVKITPETNGNEFEFENDLVASFEQPDNLTYVLKMLPNGKWGPHPALNGRAITAEDVKYSIERLASDESVINANFRPLDSVEVVDPQTLKVTLSHPFSPFIAYLSDTSASISPPEVTDKLTELETARQVHGGPWTVGAYEPGVKVTLTRNPDYYLSPVPYTDIELILFPNSSAEAIAFESKQIHVLGVSPRELARLTGEHKELVQGSSGGAHQSLFFNTTRAPWNDQRVRQALQKGIDFAAYRSIRFPDGVSVLETPARAWLAPYALPQEELETLYTLDIAGAKQLLSAAGFADGLDGGKLYAYPGGASQVENVSPVVEQLRANLDVNFAIDQIEFSDHQQMMKDAQYDVSTFIYSRRYPEVDQYLWPRLHSEGPLNYSRGSDSQLDQWLDAQRTEADPEKRIGILHDIQRRFINDLQFMIVLPTSEGNVVWWPELRDYNEHVSFGQYKHRRAWLAG